jgi:regulatory protein
MCAMKKKPRKIPTPQSLANVALYYLGRYAASEASLQRVLENRLRRVALENPSFAADHEKQSALRSAIETIIEGHKKTGAVNDAAFAETRINSLRRQGRSRRAIQQKLCAKGIRGEVLSAAFVQHEDGDEPQEVELKAATALARRRKFGPFRKTVDDAVDQDRQRKEIAAMARAGFSIDMIRKVLSVDFIETDTD